MEKAPHRFSLLMIAWLVIPLLAGACRPTRPVSQPTVAPTAVPTSVPEPAEPPTVPPSPTSAPAKRAVKAVPVFASFNESTVDTVPAVYHEAIAPDLSNVQVPFVLSQSQLEWLARDGFVVSPGGEKEFFALYEKARYTNVPIFVTSDSLLHVYHLLFDKVLRTAEVEHFIPLLQDLNQALLARAEEQYQALQGTGWEEAARRTVAFVGVASRLLDPGVQVPPYAADLVEAELALVEDRDGN